MARPPIGAVLFLLALPSTPALRFTAPGSTGAQKPPPAATQLRDALLAAAGTTAGARVDRVPLDRARIDGLIGDLSAMRVPFRGLG